MSQDPLTPGVNRFIETKSHPLIWFNLKANNYLLKSAPRSAYDELDSTTYKLDRAKAIDGGSYGRKNKRFMRK
ncbi:hypothetical protein MTR_2g058365 [Medicago truncatula]|uniref:Uncharacterized protein n=1 Tax=Medicago truncatula TaxID=3880 RepID=A0A072V7L0_MEDTR|nr:hypothetical protein MTR_2g058365 [Medicago truncatula]